RLTSDSTRFWISDTGSGFGVASQTAAGKSVATDFLKVTNANTEMREGTAGNRYTDFSPENIFLGLRSGINIEPDSYWGINNVSLGNESGSNLTLGRDNLFFGNRSGYNNIDGSFNILMGSSSGESNTSGSYNIFIGHYSGYTNSTGVGNIFLGTQTGSYNTIGSGNIFIGDQVGMNNISGSDNVFIGSRSGYFNDFGINNTFLGRFAGYNNEGYSQDNTYVGYRSGSSQLSGGKNTYLGSESGNSKSSGNSNTLIGFESGKNNQTGSGNVFLGNQSGKLETGSNKLFIENSDTASPLIYGEFDNDIVKINGKLGVGINPAYKFHVVDETTSSDQPAILGRHNVTDTYGVGVRGEGGWIGVDGNATATGTYTIMGVRGTATGAGSGVRYGVYGSASGGATNYAGYFSGNVYVTGNLYANDYIEFKSDHPTDPENRYLSHSSVSSSEMLNVYSGNVVLDEKGNTTVQMPDWFEAYNAEFRYQLTGIGSSAPGLFISEELEGGKFGIGGGNPGMKVSWMVTAVRNDNYAKANPLQVVTEKKENEKGYYLTPEVFGKSQERSIEAMYEKEAKSERER
ncbi:MAG TPA: hypothetical protein PKW56_08775, partial [Clostridiales bacterium]|nr:hypothetical protein [Clostridiales bacterium]